MARNFTHESPLNLILRAARAGAGRMRGQVFLRARAFAPGSAGPLYLGPKPRLMNSRAIRLGRHVAFGALARVEAHPQDRQGPLISIGDHTSFGDYAHIGATTGIAIGNGVLGGSNILIVDHNHGDPRADLLARSPVMPRARALSSHGPIVIGDNVWIGDQAIILGGSRIEEGAIIAAGAVIAGHVPAYTLSFGTTGKRLAA